MNLLGLFDYVGVCLFDSGICYHTYHPVHIWIWFLYPPHRRKHQRIYYPIISIAKNIVYVNRVSLCFSYYIIVSLLPVPCFSLLCYYSLLYIAVLVLIYLKRRGVRGGGEYIPASIHTQTNKQAHEPICSLYKPRIKVFIIARFYRLLATIDFVCVWVYNSLVRLREKKKNLTFSTGML